MKNHAIRSFLVLVCGASLAALSLGAAEAPVKQKTFATPQKAADALIAAAKANDVPALLAIFGPDGKEIVSTGDPVDDKNNRQKFAEKAAQQTQISYDLGDPKRAILVVGNDDWPLPVPIVQKDGKWRFDSADGKEEILARRIGGNELDAIALLRGYVEAQQEYASEDHDGNGIHEYAQKWISSPGKHDGLSWKNADGTTGGPIGEEIAELLAAGYTDKAAPVNGYYFRTLTGQGPAARLGARDYVVQGMMIGGFAAIAWPANYGVTGIQTFQVNNDGDVYQKDLGPDTATLAPAIKAYDPDKTWTITLDEE
jgi:Protein of unknown function (DUF2950)